MKKIVALLLVVIIALSLCACGAATSPTATPTAETTAEPTAETTAETTAVPTVEVTAAPAADIAGVKTVTPGCLTIGTSADFAPYEFHVMKDGQDTIVGFDISLAQAIADYLGLKLVIKDMDFNSLLLELQNGTIDMAIAGFSVDPDRAKVVDFTDVYYTGGQSFVIQTKDADLYKSFADFKGLPVAAQTGSIQADLLTKDCPDSNQVLEASMNNIILELASGKIKGAFVETVVAQNYIKNYPTLQIAWDVPYDSDGSAACVAKGNTALKDAANAVISQVTANGDMGQWVVDATNLSSQVMS
jgi:ABC-type amino acid transport/signal transduction systems, periplasmic component/domain